MATIVTRAGKGSPLTNTEVDANFSSLNTDKAELSGSTFTGNLSLGDNVKLQLGNQTNGDLQIYHSGTHSYIKDAGTGNLNILASTSINLLNGDSSDYMARFTDNGSNQFFYDGSQKLATTATGCDISGTATMDGLVVDGTNGTYTVSTNGNDFYYGRNGANYHIANTANGSFNFLTGASSANRLNINNNGNISFYEDTGTTAKLFWDASAESLGIGTTTPFDSSIHATGKIRAGGGASGGFLFGSTDFDTGMITPADGNLAFTVDGVERFRIRSGNVGIGTSSPAADLQINDGNTTRGVAGTFHMYGSAVNGDAGDVSNEIFFRDESVSGWGGAFIRTVRSEDDQNGKDALTFGTSPSGGSVVERMRIDASGNVGIGTSSPNAGSSGTQHSVLTVKGSGSLGNGILELIQKGTTGNNQTLGDIKFFDNTNHNVSIEALRATSTDSGTLGFKTRAASGSLTEAARIDSSGRLLVGISGASGFGSLESNDIAITGQAILARASGSVLVGTTSAYTGGKLSVNGGIVQPSGNQKVIGVWGTSGLQMIGVTGGDNVIGTMGANEPLVLRTGSAERLRIDSVGSVGIGTVPSTWSSTVYDALQIGGSIGVGTIASRRDAVNQVNFGLNWHYAGGSTLSYVSSSFATNYAQEAGTHRWSHASSGTAGGALTFTESMRIDSSGNLLVGTTSTAINTSTSVAGHNLFSSGYAVHARSGQTVMSLNRQTNYGTILDFRLAGSVVGSIGTLSNDLYLGTGNTTLTFTDGSRDIVPTGTNGAQDGDVISLGNANNRFKDLYLSNKVYAAYIGASSDTDTSINFDTANTIKMFTGGQEAARFNATGNFLVGGSVEAAGAQSGIAINGKNTDSNIYVRHANGTSNGSLYAAFTYNTSTLGSITQNGVSQVLFNVSSDQRLKENIVDAPSASYDIDAIQVRSFDWKADGEHQKYGMVAQELVEVAPEAVSVPEDSEEMMGVDYSKLVPMLIKEIQSLRQRVASLEE